MQNRENRVSRWKIFWIILFLPFILLALMLSINHLYFIYVYHKTYSEIIIEKRLISKKDISFLRENSEVYCEYFKYFLGWNVPDEIVSQKKFESLLKISKKEFGSIDFIYVKKDGVDYLYNNALDGYCSVKIKTTGE